MEAMGQALYRKYRSKSLDEIVGQSHITDMLRRAIAADRIAHAYLLTGPRGVGKTSIARILAHEINELPYTDESIHLDIIEIDAASNNGVDDIRELRERAMIAPSSARKKVYIIDEVHMLSKPAFNALLKTLEEPPSHVVFILATTDVEKLPATIISRVQRFNFRSIHPDDATRHLRVIADAENINIDDEALALIAHHGRGSFRDSISLLDQLQSLSDETVTRELIEQVLGLASESVVETLISSYKTSDLSSIVETLQQSERSGTPALVLAEQLILDLRRRVLMEPELLPLLDSLLDTAKSPWPHIKLLTALAGSQEVPVRSSVVPSTPAPPIANPVEKQPTPPAQKTVATPPIATKTTKPAQPEVAEPKPTKVKTPTVTAPAVSASASTSSPAQLPAQFDWQQFIATVDQTAHGAAVMLKKCGHAFDGTSLTIYAGKRFAKTNIDKAMPTLSAALQTMAPAETSINVVAEAAPASNSQAAAVLAMMGGGEEVQL